MHPATYDYGELGSHPEDVIPEKERQSPLISSGCFAHSYHHGHRAEISCLLREAPSSSNEIARANPSHCFTQNDDGNGVSNTPLISNKLR